MLALACKLVAAPAALMIDEMSMGLAPIDRGAAPARGAAHR